MSFFTHLMIFVLTGLLVMPAWAAHGLGMGYEPKYSAGFSHFDYVNPDAPKGGKLTLSASGSFDKLNPFTLKGQPPAGMGYSGNGFVFAEYGLIFEALTTASEDEPFSRYGMLAQDIELAKDGLSVSFRLNPKAKFSNGDPVLASDVKHSFDTLMSPQASPTFRSYWADIAGAVVVGERIVRFDFKRKNSELHMIIGQLPVFSAKWGKGKPFNDLVSEPPIASGAYQIDKVDYGKNISYKRRKDYWAAELPVRKGMFNFDEVDFLYFRDRVGEEESAKAGELDAIEERSISAWIRRYRGGKFATGEIVKSEIPNTRSTGMQGLVFNLRQERFKDIRVREALALAFDFDWLNQRVFYGRRVRTQSYFQNTPDLMARETLSPDEQVLLKKLRHGDELMARIDGPFPYPASTGFAAEPLRRNLVLAKQLLNEAGWNYRDGALRNKDGIAFEIAIDIAGRDSEVVLAPFARNLAKLGIALRYTVRDASLIKKKLDAFDFDMAVGMAGGSSSPGNELYDDFGSHAADQKGSQNLGGLKDPVVDELIEVIVNAPDRKAIATASRLLDRYLLYSRLVIPMYYGKQYFIAHKVRLRMPPALPPHMLPGSWLLTMWWADKKAAAK